MCDISSLWLSSIPDFFLPTHLRLSDDAHFWMIQNGQTEIAYGEWPTEVENAANTVTLYPSGAGTHTPTYSLGSGVFLLQTVDADNRCYYVDDAGAGELYRITPGGSVSLMYDDGAVASARWHPTEEVIYFVDAVANAVYKVDDTFGSPTLVVSGGLEVWNALIVAADGEVWVEDGNDVWHRIDGSSTVPSTLPAGEASPACDTGIYQGDQYAINDGSVISGDDCPSNDASPSGTYRWHGSTAGGQMELFEFTCEPVVVGQRGWIIGVGVG